MEEISAGPINDRALRERHLVDAEIVWNQRFFRQGVWRTDFVGGREFDRWSPGATKEGDPTAFFELVRPLLPATFGKPTLICGHDVAMFLIAEKKKPAWARFVSAGAIYPHGFGRSPLWAVNPHHALLVATMPKPGFDAGAQAQYGHAYAMIDPSQGVFIGSPIG